MSPQVDATSGNQIDVPPKSWKVNRNSNDNRFQRIAWRKDGENITKDAHFNFRFANARPSALSIISTDVGFIPLIFFCSPSVDSLLAFADADRSRNSVNGGWIISRLSILSAERVHSGIYSCSIDDSVTTNVEVQILNGLYTAPTDQSQMMNYSLGISVSLFFLSPASAGEIPAAVQHSAADRIHALRGRIEQLTFAAIILYISC